MTAVALDFAVAAGRAIANPVGVPPAATLGLIPPARAQGEFFYRVDNAP